MRAESASIISPVAAAAVVWLASYALAIGDIVHSNYVLLGAILAGGVPAAIVIAVLANIYLRPQLQQHENFTPAICTLVALLFSAVVGVIFLGLVPLLFYVVLWGALAGYLYGAFVCVPAT